MNFADRTRTVAPFFAMEFGKRAAALEAQGHHVIKLSLGEPDFGAPPSVVQAMHKALDQSRTAYTPALGISELRQAISLPRHYATTHDVDIDPGRVIVTAGASAALLLLTAALVNSGDEVLVGDPSYPCNRHFLTSFGARVNLVPTTVETRYQLDLSLVQQYWESRTCGLMVATPSNPTGTSVPPNELAAICRYVRARGGWRIVDEIYLGLQDGTTSRTHARTVLAEDPGALVNSFSKYFGMTGWRLGWCVVPPTMVDIVERLAQNYYICPSAPAQYAAVRCFDPESIAECERRRTMLVQRRALVLRGLDSIGLKVPVKPDGAFYVYTRHQLQEGMNASAFASVL